MLGCQPRLKIIYSAVFLKHFPKKSYLADPIFPKKKYEFNLVFDWTKTVENNKENINIQIYILNCNNNKKEKKIKVKK